MILIAHILIALTSLFITAAAFVRPSQTALKLSWSFVVLTISTGTLVAIASPAHMVQACVSGLIYTAVVVSATIIAKRKLTTVER